jgi:NADPH-dependent curcumin reductase CurA
VESKSDNFKVGDTVVGNFHGRKYFSKRIKYKVDSSIPELSYYLSILGMTGLTLFWVDGYANQRPEKLS